MMNDTTDVWRDHTENACLASAKLYGRTIHEGGTAMKIVSVKDKRVKALVENPSRTSVKGLDALETRKIAEMIAAINVMTSPLQLRSVPSWKAHELIPGQPGKWSLTVTRNYRLTFIVNQAAQTVSVLDYEDYH